MLDFHGIGPKPSWVEAAEDLYWCDCPETFGQTLDTVIATSKSTGRPIEITFDDGNESDFSIAAPALALRGLGATFFVCAGRIGQPGYLDRTQMNEMISAGFRIGSHGWSHINWRKADERTLEQEIGEAKRKIEDVIGRGVDSVAIPFGSYDRRVMTKLDGFATVYTSDRGLAAAGARIVPRTSYRKDWTAETARELAATPEGLLAGLRNSLSVKMKGLR